MLTREALLAYRCDFEDSEIDDALRMALALLDIADAWQRYQRGDLSREEFEGTVAERTEKP